MRRRRCGRDGTRQDRACSGSWDSGFLGLRFSGGYQKYLTRLFKSIAMLGDIPGGCQCTDSALFPERMGPENGGNHSGRSSRIHIKCSNCSTARTDSNEENVPTTLLHADGITGRAGDRRRVQPDDPEWAIPIRSPDGRGSSRPSRWFRFPNLESGNEFSAIFLPMEAAFWRGGDVWGIQAVAHL